MAIEIRRTRPGELGAALDVLTTTFLDRPRVAEVAAELGTLWDLDRLWTAHDDGRICATFRSWASELTVPGGARLAASAVTAVTVLPTHRRQGILRSMVAAEHAAARERGEVLALLHSAEYPIYGRFGYGPATVEASWTLDTRTAQIRRPASGSVEFAAAGPASADTMRDVFDRWRAGQAGEMRRPDYRWGIELGLRPSSWGTTWSGFLVLHRDDDGAVDGYARYNRTEDRWDQNRPSNVVELDELHALTTDAYVGLWRFLTELDWVGRVRAPRRAVDERLPWLLTDARDVQLTEVADGLWVRLFDVQAALGARTYERAGRIVLEVVDPEADTGSLRLRLEASPEGATCVATTASADLTVPVAALGAAYLGGTRLRQAVLATGVDEHRHGALDDLDALLRTSDQPWCSTFF